MNATKLYAASLLIILSSLYSYSQSNKEVIIENVPENLVWQLVKTTFNDLNLPYVKINKQLNTAETNFYNYNTLISKNRLKFKFEYNNNQLAISIFNREYQSSSGWSPNPIPMSKKQVGKTLNPIKERILELLNDKNYIAKAAKSITPNKSKQPRGIYKDFAIAKTKHKEIELLTIHENGNLLGIRLNEDKIGINSFVFQENIKSNKTVLIFDKEGNPKSIITPDHIIKITQIDNANAQIEIFNTKGEFLVTSEFALNNFETHSSKIISDFNSNGPSVPSISHTTGIPSLSNSMGYAATALKGISCAVSLASVVGAAGAVIPCSALLLDVLQRVSDKDAFYYDELVVTDKVFAAITFRNPVGTLDNVSTVIDGMNYALEGSTSIYNKISPPGNLVIEGNNTIISGEFGEFSYHNLILYAKSNYPKYPIEWSINSHDLISEPIKKGDFAYREGIPGIKVFAKEGLMKNNYIIATQFMDEEIITTKKEIIITKPKYYYIPYPSCDEMYKSKIISSEELAKCQKEFKKCFENLKKEHYIVLQDDPQTKTDLLNQNFSNRDDPEAQKVNFIRKIWKNDGSLYTGSEAGALRDFVKVAPCLANWSGLGDKNQIIILANEGLLKVKSIEDRIKELQKVANASNYAKIATDIKNLENSITPIKNEYTEKINKIAEKRTIKYTTEKTDKEQYYDVKGAEVMGFRWDKYGGQMIEVDIYFSSRVITKEINGRNFNFELRTMYCNFENYSEKPVGYGLIVSKEMKKENKLKTAIKLDLFQNGFEYINFHKSNARTSRK